MTPLTDTDREFARRTLTDKQFTALTMNHAGQGYKQIALALHVSVSTARSLVFAARTNLEKAKREAA